MGVAPVAAAAARSGPVRARFGRWWRRMAWWPLVASPPAPGGLPPASVGGWGAATRLQGEWHVRLRSGSGIRVDDAGGEAAGCSRCSERGRQRAEVRHMVVASRGRGGYTVVWQICPRRWPAISGVGSFAVGPLRPSLHLLVVRVILRSRGWPSPSCGPSLVSRPELQDGVRLAPGSRTELISRPATEQSSSCARQQDGARLAPGGGTELVSRSGLQDRRWRPVLASLLGLGAGGRPGV